MKPSVVNVDLATVHPALDRKRDLPTSKSTPVRFESVVDHSLSSESSSPFFSLEGMPFSTMAIMKKVLGAPTQDVCFNTQEINEKNTHTYQNSNLSQLHLPYASFQATIPVSRVELV